MTFSSVFSFLSFLLEEKYTSSKNSSWAAALKPTRSITIKDVNFMGFIFVSPLLYNISTL